MDQHSFIIRNYRPADSDTYVRFYSEAVSICHSRDSFLLAWLTGQSARPDDFSEENLLIAEREGALVGACHLVPEMAIDRVVLRLCVIPGVLAQNIALTLLRAALERTTALGATTLHADLKEDDSANRTLFASLGFAPVRRYTEMTLALGAVTVPELKYDRLTYRALEPGGEAEFAQLQNRVFAGSWGFCPNTTSQIVQQLNTPGYGHHGVILAYHARKAVGYCWTAQPRQPNLINRATNGRIHMMGVAPEFRNKGQGKHILWSGVKYLASKGVHTVELTVDNQNAPACSLYRSAGFTPATALVWYERRMR